MPINWFPGHMHKARKEIAQVMSQVDVIFELLDARVPFSSENPLVPELRGDTPCIKLLTKADLADPQRTQVWIERLERIRGVRALAVSLNEPTSTEHLLELSASLLPERNFALRPLRAMALGVPNVGKSTLINRLAGRKVAKTGDEAGITKAQQKIKLDNRVLLTDTPGFLWPKLDPPECGFRLAATGAIKDTVFDYADVALFVVEYLAEHYPQGLRERYRITHLPEDGVEMLDAIGVQRGCVRRRGGVDLQKVSALLINELRAGHLGRVTLETPEQVDAEVIEAEHQAQLRAAEKARHDRTRREKAKKRKR